MDVVLTNASPIMLGPPSPPAAPHLGTLYTLSLLDAAKRMSAYLGRPALVPEAWNLSSRRIESQFADEGEEYFNYCAGAVAQARSILAKFGIDLDQDVPVRDDVHESRVELQSAVVELCERGEIAERRVEENGVFPVSSLFQPLRRQLCASSVARTSNCGKQRTGSYGSIRFRSLNARSQSDGIRPMRFDAFKT